jgi:hypothetical protein
MPHLDPASFDRFRAGEFDSRRFETPQVANEAGHIGEFGGQIDEILPPLLAFGND